MKCNGCGIEMDTLGGTFSYGNVSDPHMPDLKSPVPSMVDPPKYVQADYHKTLCPRCQHVLKDILTSSDLSDHWHKYEWSLMNNDAYTEPYDGE